MVFLQAEQWELEVVTAARIAGIPSTEIIELVVTDVNSAVTRTNVPLAHVDMFELVDSVPGKRLPPLVVECPAGER